jgi:hypothetical protein
MFVQAPAITTLDLGATIVILMCATIVPRARAMEFQLPCERCGIIIHQGTSDPNKCSVSARCYLS